MRLTTVLVTLVVLAVIGAFLAKGLNKMLTAEYARTDARLAEALR